MRHANTAQLQTAPFKQGGESVYLFFEFTYRRRRGSCHEDGVRRKAEVVSRNAGDANYA